jgi:integrase
VSVYRRGRIWWYVFEIDGRRIIESSKHKNKKAAKDTEAARRTAILEGRAGFRRPDPPPKFDDAVKEFLAWSEQKHRPKTHGLHKLNCDTLLRYFRNKWLDQITPDLVEEFRQHRQSEARRNANDGSKVAPATVNRALATLRLLFTQRGLKPPTRKEMFLEETEKTRVVTAEEEMAYLRAAGQPLRDIATVILQTGMRPEEVFRLEVRYVDLDQRTIFNPFGKTKAAKRKIPMSNDAFEVLKRRVNAARGRWVFCSPGGPGRPENPDVHVCTVRRGHDAAIRRAGIKEHFRLYDLRHTFATHAAQAGVDVLTLASLLGHTTVQMTMRYVHPTDQHKREAAEKLETYNRESLFKLAEKIDAGYLQNPLQ